MDHRIQQMQQKLAFLGYRRYQIQRIMEESNGSHEQLLLDLQKYDVLGADYVQGYSK